MSQKKEFCFDDDNVGTFLLVFPDLMHILQYLFLLSNPDLKPLILSNHEAEQKIGLYGG